MKRAIAFAYGVACYVVFLGTFLYAIGFIGNFGVPKSMDSPADGPWLTAPFLYRMVRHPLYVGWLFTFWSAPMMTVTHLFFAAVTTGYILVAVQFEEHDLVREHPDSACRCLFRGSLRRGASAMP